MTVDHTMAAAGSKGPQADRLMRALGVAKSVDVDVLANDMRMPGTKLTVLPLEGAPEGVRLRSGTGPVRIVAPEDDTTTRVVYTITNGLSESRGVVTVKGRDDFNNPPVVEDIFATPDPDATSVEVDVLGKAFDLDGPEDELVLDDVSGDIYIAGSNLNQAMHGDRVMARIERKNGDRAEGRIVRILDRGSSSIVGRFDRDASGDGFVVPFDRRLIMDVNIPDGDEGSAEPGDMVVVEITRWPTPARGPLGRIIEVLGDIDEPGVDIEIIIRKYGIPDEHSDEAVNEAKRLGTQVKDRDVRGRTDFRPLVTVTIDGEHARDFDDAITIERLANGNYWLGVHIADVSHYVKEGSALDEEGYERGTSVYFPERAVHMFPSELATGLCSLNPHVDRLVQSCLMEVDRRGTVVRYEMYDGVINSDARMTYTDVNAILTDRDTATMARHVELVPMFELMHELFEILHARRRRRGSIDFDLPEKTPVYCARAGKIVLTLEMWMGRLEVMTVLVLLRLEPWRTARWSAA